MQLGRIRKELRAKESSLYWLGEEQRTSPSTHPARAQEGEEGTVSTLPDVFSKTTEGLFQALGTPSFTLGEIESVKGGPLSSKRSSSGKTRRQTPAIA